MAEPVKYVPFGGAQVPEGAKREIIDSNGQKMYCVWTDDKGGKVTYPEQHTYPTNQYEYRVWDLDGFEDLNKNISREEFDSKWKSLTTDNKTKKIEKYYGYYTEYSLHHGELSYSGEEIRGNDIVRPSKMMKLSYKRASVYYTAKQLDTTPTITTTIDSGMIYDTQNVTLSNMRGATVTGSSDEDNITLRNSSNCTVDVSNANNNMFVSDNVKVVNGQGNKVKAGNHDQVTFRTFNYETATETTQADYKGEGTYKQ